MQDADLLIRNGTVVTADAQELADIAVCGESIAAIAPCVQARAVQIIDATGCYVFPGFIDPHVHMSLPLGGGLVSSDDFASGTVAAACGGTTTIVDFTTQERGAPLHEAVANRRAEADGKAAIDYGLHLTVTDAEPATLRAVAQLAADGYSSLKLYMTYTSLMVHDEAMLRIMAAAARCGALCLVHAENHEIVSHLTGRLLGEGRTAPEAHPEARPPWAEAEATTRAIALARAARAPLYLVHVSCAEALAAVAQARAEGQAVYAETCPHYLLLSDEEYRRPGFEAARFVMTPPLRAQRNWQPLWQGLAGGVLDVVATDHCPWLYETQKARGRERFDLIPGGIAGVETRPALLFSEGVGKGRLTLQQFVSVLATNPARLFGLYPRKGTLAVGSDADIVVFDPRRTATIRCQDLHQRVDYTVFEGWPVRGQAVVTISRGRVVASDGQFVGEVGHGRFVARSLRNG